MTTSPSLVDTLRDAAGRSAASGEPDAVALAELRASGLLGTAVPVAYGGAGGDATDINRVVARVAEVNPSVAIILFQHFAVSARIDEWGTPAQKAALLPALASGRLLAASAWSETGAGAAKKKLGTTGTRLDDGRWLLDGAKSFTTSAGIADIYLVLVQTAEAEDDLSGPPVSGLTSTEAPARNEPGVSARRREDTGDRPANAERSEAMSQPSSYGSAGQSFFLVRGENPGIVPDLGLDLLGMRGSATGFVSLRECVVDDADRLGPLGEAPAIIAGVRETGATLGAVSVGIARAALDLALAHAARLTPEARTNLRHRLVKISTLAEAAEALVDRAGQRISAVPGITTLQSKLHASTVAEQVCVEVARMLGSAGYVVAHRLNRLTADARAVALMGPTNELCRELVAGSW
jgi:alkylation response protein AidB-like acyl-CoA dehydrogenase